MCGNNCLLTFCSGGWGSGQLRRVRLCSCDASHTAGSPERARQVLMSACVSSTSMFWLCKSVCDLKWIYLFIYFWSQRRAVVILPDGTVKPAREAWLSAQYPGLHHHGHSRAEGRGDQQPRGDGGQAGWPRYRKKFFSVDCVYRYFLQIFLFASQNMIMPYMQKVSGSIPEGSTNPASGDHKPLYSQHRSRALTEICRFSLINTMYKKKKQKRKLIFQETCYPILHRSSVSLRKLAPGNQVEEMFSFFVYQQQVSVNHTLWTTKACIFTFVKAHSADATVGQKSI